MRESRADWKPQRFRLELPEALEDDATKIDFRRTVRASEMKASEIVNTEVAGVQCKDG